MPSVSLLGKILHECLLRDAYLIQKSKEGLTSQAEETYLTEVYGRPGDRKERKPDHDMADSFCWPVF